MNQVSEMVFIPTQGPGLYSLMDQVHTFLQDNRFQQGTLHAFIHHTSASLLITENADPDVHRDLERFFLKLVPRQERYLHSAEGPDDMPAHIRSALTQTSLTIPVMEGKASFGTWQSLYLWEHRDAPHRRRVTFMAQGQLG